MKAGRKLGMQPKIHANELAVSGGVQVGVEYDALSVDHLERMGEAEIRALRGAVTSPTMLPGAAFFLGMSYLAARAMIRAGLGVALASDYNPGSSPSGDMRMVGVAGLHPHEDDPGRSDQRRDAQRRLRHGAEPRATVASL